MQRRLGYSDAFVGRRVELRRTLICPLQGYFPVLAHKDETMWAAYRTGGAHFGITGTIAVSRSDDGGISWSDPIEVAPRGRDVRNPALGTNSDGTLLLSYWEAAAHCYKDRGGELRWQDPRPEAPPDEPGLFITSSSDGGRSWSRPTAYRSELATLLSPYGRIVAGRDGELLMPAYGRLRSGDQMHSAAIIVRSRDGGASWGEETIIANHCNETSLCLLDDGRLLAAARTERGEVAVTTSVDGGQHFSEPRPVTRAGEHPADITQLRDGRVLLTYGRRIRPLGCGALISADGASWDLAREVVLAGDGIGNDVGYPSTVQLSDESLVTALYFGGGSAASESPEGWGQVSCQAIHWRLSDVFGA